MEWTARILRRIAVRDRELSLLPVDTRKRSRQFSIEQVEGRTLLAGNASTPWPVLETVRDEQFAG